MAFCLLLWLEVPSSFSASCIFILLVCIVQNHASIDAVDRVRSRSARCCVVGQTKVCLMD